jgi:hypothetical protein
VVLEAHGRAGTEIVVIRLQNGRQIVERIRRNAETGAGLQSTQSSRDAD